MLNELEKQYNKFWDFTIDDNGEPVFANFKSNYAEMQKFIDENFIPKFHIKDIIGFIENMIQDGDNNSQHIINYIKKIEKNNNTHICKYCDVESSEDDELCYKCPTEDLLYKVMELSQRFWDLENGGHAVVWARNDETGQFFAYTRSEYSDDLIKYIENLKTLM